MESLRDSPDVIFDFGRQNYPELLLLHCGGYSPDAVAIISAHAAKVALAFIEKSNRSGPIEDIGKTAGGLAFAVPGGCASLDLIDAIERAGGRFHTTRIEGALPRNVKRV